MDVIYVKKIDFFLIIIIKAPISIKTVQMFLPMRLSSNLKLRCHNSAHAVHVLKRNWQCRARPSFVCTISSSFTPQSIEMD